MVDDMRRKVPGTVTLSPLTVAVIILQAERRLREREVDSPQTQRDETCD